MDCPRIATISSSPAPRDTTRVRLQKKPRRLSRKLVAEPAAASSKGSRSNLASAARKTRKSSSSAPSIDQLAIDLTVQQREESRRTTPVTQRSSYERDCRYRR